MLNKNKKIIIGVGSAVVATGTALGVSLPLLLNKGPKTKIDTLLDKHLNTKFNNILSSPNKSQTKSVLKSIFTPPKDKNDPAKPINENLINALTNHINKNQKTLEIKVYTKEVNGLKKTLIVFTNKMTTPQKTLVNSSGSNYDSLPSIFKAKMHKATFALYSVQSELKLISSEILVSPTQKNQVPQEFSVGVNYDSYEKKLIIILNKLKVSDINESSLTANGNKKASKVVIKDLINATEKLKPISDINFLNFIAQQSIKKFAITLLEKGQTSLKISINYLGLNKELIINNFKDKDINSALAKTSMDFAKKYFSGDKPVKENQLLPSKFKSSPKLSDINSYLKTPLINQPNVKITLKTDLARKKTEQGFIVSITSTEDPSLRADVKLNLIGFIEIDYFKVKAELALFNITSTYVAKKTSIAAATKAKFIDGTLGIAKPSKVTGAITYSHAEINTDGPVQVTIAVTIGDKTSTKVITVAVSGIKELIAKKLSNDISQAKAIFSPINADSNKLPKIEVKPEISIDANGVKIEYTSWTPNNDTGEIAYEVTFSKNGKSVKTSGTISGYKTQAEVDLTKAKAELALFSATSTYVAKKTSIAAATKAKFIDGTLGIAKPSKVTGAITYSHAEIKADGPVQVTIEVTIDGKISTKVITVTVSGINKLIAQKLSNDISQAKAIFSPINADSNKLPKIEVKPEISIDANGVKIEYTSWTPNNDTGEIAYEVTFSKNGKSVKTSGTISGYKTQAKVDLTKAKAELALFSPTSTYVAKQTSIVAATKAKFTDGILGIAKPSKVTETITYSHAEIKADGPVQVTIEVTIGGQTSTKVITVTVSGINKLIAQKLSTDITQAQDDFFPINADSNKLPKIEVKPEISIDANGVKIEYTSWTPDNDTGEIAYEVTFSKNGKSVKTSGTISGYKTQAEVDLTKAKTELALFSATSTYVAKKTSIAAATKAKFIDGTLGIAKPSKVTGAIIYSHAEINTDGPVQVTIAVTIGDKTSTKVITVAVSGINKLIAQKLSNDISQAKAIFSPINADSNKLPKIEVKPEISIDANGVKIEYTSWTPNNDTGEIAYEVTFSKNGKSVKTSGTISGYKTQAEVDLTKAKAELALFSPTSTYVAKQTSIVAATKAKFIDGTLGIAKPSKVTGAITYSHAEIKADGPVQVTIEVTIGGKTSTKVITVAVSGINKLIAKKLSNDISQAKAIFSPINADSNKLPKIEVKPEISIDANGVKIEYTSWTPNNDTGEIAYEVTFSKNGKSVKTSGTISGYKTQAEVDLTKAKAELALFSPTSTYVAKQTSIIAATKAKFTDGILGIAKPSKVTGAITYSHAEINTDGPVQVTIAVTIGDKTSTKVITVAVSGIKELIAKKLSNDISQAKAIFSPINADSNKLPKIEVKPEISIDANGVKIEYTSWTPNNDTGEIAYEVTFSKNGKSVKTSGTISGYKTQAEVDLTKAKAELALFSATSTYVAKKTSIAAATKAKFIDGTLGIAKPSKVTGAITYSHAEIKADGPVQVTIEVTIDGKTSTKVITVTVSGIKELIDNKLITAEMSKIDKINAKNPIVSPRTEVLSKGDVFVPSSLSNPSVIPGPTTNIKKTYIVDSFNPDMGVAVIKVIISTTDGIRREGTFEVKGYITTAQKKADLEANKITESKISELLLSGGFLNIKKSALGAINESRKSGFKPFIINGVTIALTLESKSSINAVLWEAKNATAPNVDPKILDKIKRMKGKIIGFLSPLVAARNKKVDTAFAAGASAIESKLTPLLGDKNRTATEVVASIENPIWVTIENLKIRIEIVADPVLNIIKWNVSALSGVDESNSPNKAKIKAFKGEISGFVSSLESNPLKLIKKDDKNSISKSAKKTSKLTNTEDAIDIY